MSAEDRAALLAERANRVNAPRGDAQIESSGAAGFALPNVLKDSGGAVIGYQLANISDGWRFVKLFDQATDPAPSDGDVPKIIIAMPPGSFRELSFGFGSPFNEGIAVIATQGLADNNEQAAAAGEIIGAVLYR